MTIIHMDTEEVQNTADLINSTVAQLRSLKSSLNKAKWHLITSWISLKSIDFQNDFGIILRCFDENIDALSFLNSKVNREVDEWLHVDAWFYKKGMLDENREKLKSIFNDDTSTVIDGLSLATIFIPGPWIGPIIGMIIDAGGGVNDFMDWSIADWERYDTFGEEAAATIYDYLFALEKTKTLIGVDAAAVILDPEILAAIFPPAVAATYGAGVFIGAIFWALGQTIGNAYDAGYELLDQAGAKDLFVKYLGQYINDQIKAYDATFNPYKNQIMTSPVN